MSIQEFTQTPTRRAPKKFTGPTAASAPAPLKRPTPYEEARALLSAFAGQQQIVTCPRAYIDFLGDFKAAHVLNQLIFWSGKSADGDGWFYKSYREWEHEIGLSKNEVSRAVQSLDRLGFVETRVRKVQGVTPTVHYRLNWHSVVGTLQVFLAYPVAARQQWRRGMQRWLRSGNPPVSDFQKWMGDFQKTLSAFQKSQDFWFSEIPSAEELQKNTAEENPHIACAQARETGEGKDTTETDAELTDLAIALVQQFYQTFHGSVSVLPHPRELEHATALIARHGWDFATFFVPFAYRITHADGQRLHVFGGLLRYEASALAAYQRRQAQRQKVCQEAGEAHETRLRQRYERERTARIEAYRARLPRGDLEALRAQVYRELTAAETIPSCALKLRVQVELDEQLASQAGMPAFEDWRREREAVHG